MANNVGDRVLWTAVLVTGIAACWYLPYVLKDIKEAAVVSVNQPKSAKPRLEKDVEAAIKPSTLAELANGPSYNLAASAMRLSAAKFLKSDAKKFLLQDLASKHHTHREKAINAFRLLLTNPAFLDHSIRSHFTDDATFSAFVSALVNLLPEHEQACESRYPSPSPSPSPIRPANRPAHELAILNLLGTLMNEPRRVGTSNSNSYVVDAQPAINAGIITRWLKHYPFPCTLPENRRWNFKRHDVCHLLRENEWASDDEAMSSLVQMLMKNPMGARQLAEVGLRKSSVLDGDNPMPWEWRLTRRHNTRLSEPTFDDMFPDSPWEDDDDVEEGGLIDNDEMMARLQDFPPPRGGRTAGERSLRRRHRQAVVVVEAGVPLSAENILQRLPTETELTWQEEIAERQGNILRSARANGDVARARNAGVEETVDGATDHIALERIDGMQEGLARGVREGPIPPGIDLAEIQWDLDPDPEPSSSSDADADIHSGDDDDDDDDEDMAPY